MPLWIHIRISDCKVIRTEYTTLNTDTGEAVIHKCDTYFLKDGDKDIMFRRYRNVKDPIKWKKVSEV
jgi:hypothetical protein